MVIISAMLAYCSFTAEDHGRWALLTPNNFVVCGQKNNIKCGHSFFLVRMSGTL